MTFHRKNRDWEKVNAGDPGHINEMKQEIVNLDKRIKELEMALNSGKLDKEQKRRVERVLEATQKVRDAYQAAGIKPRNRNRPDLYPCKITYCSWPS